MQSNNEIVRKITQEYIRAVQECWKLDRFPTADVGKMLYYTGWMGSDLFDREFEREGPAAYSTSILQAIRNLWYSSQVVPQRWDKFFSNKKLVEPVLDFGCGVGFLLKFLQEQGVEDVYGWDISPIQMDLMKAVGLQVWDKQTPAEFGTVICINTLEHVEDPVGMLKYLQSLAPTVYANCDISEQPAHLAPQAERLKCIQILKEAGTYTGSA